MLTLYAVRSRAVEANPKYQAAVRAQKEKLNPVPIPVVELPNPEPVIQFTPSAIRQIIMDVANKHNVTHDDIIGRSRKYHIVAARDEAISAVSVARPKLSLNGIAKHFGNRDHTTILHSLRKKGLGNV